MLNNAVREVMNTVRVQKRPFSLLTPLTKKKKNYLCTRIKKKCSLNFLTALSKNEVLYIVIRFFLRFNFSRKTRGYLKFAPDSLLSLPKSKQNITILTMFILINSYLNVFFLLLVVSSCSQLLTH